ncbi:hypothetical protein T459_35135 [Capsicum annuum]|uniref:Uncharacterized protein n=1 Tax=Capsicum annuum TaxID=4072 RepID=A0A2G2XU55_CAPAN|nr:hypothetical protein T459_35135 [Capsicum annuum]
MSSRLLGFCQNLKTLEDSKDVAEDVKSFATDDPDEQRLHVFFISSILFSNIAFSDFEVVRSAIESFQVIITKDKNENTVDMAHTSVASLTRTIESLLTSNSPMQSLICDHREELCALHEKGISNIWTRRKFRKSLQQFAKGIDRVRKESTKIQDKGKQASKESTIQDFSSSANDNLNVKNNMVGRDDQMKRLLEDLTISYSDEPKVIPIVGMGGIGKKTLAKEAYNNKSVLHCFDVHAWATISQQHNRKEIFLGLLRSTIKVDDTVETSGEAGLADMLQKILKRKSRILLTTRNDEVACYAGVENLSLRMSFMDQDESWSLFKSAAFASEALPSEFETTGKQIAEKCHGLPLTIVVVAGLLKSKREIEDWENVAKDVKSCLTNDPDEICSRVLGLSYNHMTSDLKACLLHFGIFLEDSEITAKKLMRSWMAEGFLNLENDLEGEAEKCLQELVDRCLVLVCKTSLDGAKFTSCPKIIPRRDWHPITPRAGRTNLPYTLPVNKQ